MLPWSVHRANMMVKFERPANVSRQGSRKEHIRQPGLPANMLLSMLAAEHKDEWTQNPPAILAPLNGCWEPNSVRQAISPGISASARSISRRPKSAWVMSLTLYCRRVKKCCL